MKKIMMALGGVAVLGLLAVLGVGTAFSGKKSVGKTIALEQKSERVFETLSSLERLPELGIGVKSVKLPSDGSPPGPGYKFELQTEYGAAEAEIVTYDAPRALAFDVTLKGKKVGNLSFELQGGDGATTDLDVKLNLDSPPPLGGLKNLGAQWTVSTLLESNADKLKEALESAK